MHTVPYGKYLGEDMRSHWFIEIPQPAVQDVSWNLRLPARHAAVATISAIRGAKKSAGCALPGGLLKEASP